MPYPLPCPVDVLAAILGYDAATGEFVWLEPQAAQIKVGAVAGSTSSGYRVICLFGRKFKAHRLAWAIHYGAMPEGDIDHINGDSLDNRISNLREASRAQNCQNSRCKRQGLKGAYFNKRLNKWHSAIRVNGKPTHLGYCGTEQEAHELYAAAANKYFGEFARTA